MLLPFVKEQYDVTHKCGVYNDLCSIYVSAGQISMCVKARLALSYLISWQLSADP